MKWFGKRKETPPILRLSVQSNVETVAMGIQPEFPIPDGLEVSMATILGDREDQQDTLRLRQVQAGVAGVVCDGMGGLANGARASQAAADTFLALIEKTEAALLPETFESALARINAAVLQSAPGGGSTLVGAVVCENRLYYCAVGDSRLFVFRNGQIINATRKHNYEMLLDEARSSGRIGRVEYQRELSRKDALVSYFGAADVRFAEINRAPFPLLCGDVVLLCSDGLYNSIPEDRLNRIISSYAGSFSTLADYLVNTAARLCAQRDNTSLILIRVC